VGTGGGRPPPVTRWEAPRGVPLSQFPRVDEAVVVVPNIPFTQEAREVVAERTRNFGSFRRCLCRPAGFPGGLVLLREHWDFVRGAPPHLIEPT